MGKSQCRSELDLFILHSACTRCFKQTMLHLYCCCNCCIVPFCRRRRWLLCCWNLERGKLQKTVNFSLLICRRQCEGKGNALIKNIRIDIKHIYSHTYTHCPNANRIVCTNKLSSCRMVLNQWANEWTLALRNLTQSTSNLVNHHAVGKEYLPHAPVETITPLIVEVAV